jgi:hypothetical protein
LEEAVGRKFSRDNSADFFVKVAECRVISQSKSQFIRIIGFPVLAGRNECSGQVKEGVKIEREREREIERA